MEMLALGDVFVAALRYRVSRVLKGNRDAVLERTRVEPEFADMDRGTYYDATLAHTERVAVRVGHDTTADFFVSISATAWMYPREAKACPALAADGKACTIHERRPLTCRTVPARYDVPAELLSRAVRATVERGRAEHGYECDVSDSAPVFIDGDTLVDGAYVKDRDAALAAIDSERNLHERLLQSERLPKPPEIVKAAGPHMDVSVSFPAVVIEALEAGAIELPAAREFVEKQMTLLDAAISRALARKDRGERETTGRFRKVRDSYATILKATAK
jgi:Fe-S-cluster containining protein